MAKDKGRKTRSNDWQRPGEAGAAIHEVVAALGLRRRLPHGEIDAREDLEGEALLEDDDGEDEYGLQECEVGEDVQRIVRE